MEVIKKSDLLKSTYEYKWTIEDGDNPKITGKPDKDRLDRSEGYEMVDFINYICKTFNLTTKKEAFEIEELLQNKVPSNMVMKDEIEEKLSSLLFVKERVKNFVKDKQKSLYESINERFQEGDKKDE
ncbi:hypothetical protein [Tenacibaculum sp. Ill]|uniref:hypothetical protein n=1 Tax=Tenacibaculum sp. Ill TaxID=3445935 RepID=UPI003F7A6EED